MYVHIYAIHYVDDDAMLMMMTAQGEDETNNVDTIYKKSINLLVVLLVSGTNSPSRRSQSSIIHLSIHSAIHPIHIHTQSGNYNVVKMNMNGFVTSCRGL